MTDSKLDIRFTKDFTTNEMLEIADKLKGRGGAYIPETEGHILVNRIKKALYDKDFSEYCNNNTNLDRHEIRKYLETYPPIKNKPVEIFELCYTPRNGKKDFFNWCCTVDHSHNQVSLGYIYLYKEDFNSDDNGLYGDFHEYLCCYYKRSIIYVEFNNNYRY